MGKNDFILSELNSFQKNKTNNNLRFGYYFSLSTSILALLTFGTAVFTPPISGPFCKGQCIDYPYTDIISRFPGDYLWMFPAMLLLLSFVALMACIHNYAPNEKKVFTQIGLSLSIMSATALLLVYYTQVSVIQPSLLKGETDGISLITQYNPHGLFVAIEEIGYLLMSLALIAIAFVFDPSNKREKAIRWILIINLILVMISFAIISFKFVIQREYFFEVAIITINYITLILSGILLSRFFKIVLKRNRAI
jgi:hypothetical protein